MNGKQQPQLSHVPPWRCSSKGKTLSSALPLEEWQKTVGKWKEKIKIHETDFLLCWGRRVATWESIRSCGDSPSLCPKAVWAVNLQQTEITIHVTVPEAQRVEGWVQKSLGVDFIYLDSTSCPPWPEPLECALILRGFRDTGWSHQ